MPKQISDIQSVCTPHFSLVIDNEDGNPPKTWKLCVDYRALAKIEIETKRDLKQVEAWKDLSSGKDFPVIIWCCLLRYQPELTLDEVLDILNPAAQRALSDVLFDLCFPGVKELWEKHQAEAMAGATADPNVGTATPK